MPEYTRDDALTFIESMRLMLGGRVGFQWLGAKLSDLAVYVESIAAENERLNAYLDRSHARDDYESYRAASVDDAPPSDTTEAD